MRGVSRLPVIVLLIVLGLSITLWSNSVRTEAADPVRKFDPPTVKIELSRFEPAPATANKVTELPEASIDKGTGILSQDYDHARTARGPYWDAAPFALVFPQGDDNGWNLTVNPASFPLLRACGYQSDAAPKGT